METREAERPGPRAARGWDGRLEFSFPSDVRHAGPAVERVVDAFRRTGRSAPRTRLHLRVAVGEAVSNAILHGNGEDPARRVTVEAEFGPVRTRVTVADEGEGFDPGARPETAGPPPRDRPGGRGLYLMRRLAEEVRFGEAGSRVTLVLRV